MSATLTIQDLTTGQAVEIRWQGDQWLPATIHRIYEGGADCGVGSRGVHYVQTVDIREPS